MDVVVRVKNRAEERVEEYQISYVERIALEQWDTHSDLTIYRRNRQGFLEGTSIPTSLEVEIIPAPVAQR